MTGNQFSAFMAQLDQSLAEISREVAMHDPPVGAVTALALQTTIRRIRQGFLEISKHIAPAKVKHEFLPPFAEIKNVYPVAQKTDLVPAFIERFTPVDLYYQNQEWLARWSA